MDFFAKELSTLMCILFFMYEIKIGLKGNPSFSLSVLSQWRCVVTRQSQMLLEEVVLLHSSFHILKLLKSAWSTKATQN